MKFILKIKKKSSIYYCQRNRICCCCNWLVSIEIWLAMRMRQMAPIDCLQN